MAESQTADFDIALTSKICTSAILLVLFFKRLKILVTWEPYAMKFILLFVKIGKFLRLKGHRQIHRGRADDMSLTFSLTKESKSKNSNYVRKFLIRRGEMFAACPVLPQGKRNFGVLGDKRPVLCSDKT